MIIALQCCVGFCHKARWISHSHTYIPSLGNLPPGPIPIPLGCHRALGWARCFIQVPTICFAYGNAYVSVLLSQFIPEKTSWRRLLGVPWTGRKSNQSILKEMSPKYSVVEAETPIIWPPDVKSWLTGEDPDSRKDWSQEEKGGKVVGWHHRFDGHEFE